MKPAPEGFADALDHGWVIVTEDFIGPKVYPFATRCSWPNCDCPDFDLCPPKPVAAKAAPTFPPAETPFMWRDAGGVWRAK